MRCEGENDRMTKRIRDGRVTLPTEENFYAETVELMERWGADAIRDADGTELTDEVKALNATIYSKYFVARNHNEFIVDYPEERQQLYLMSEYFTAKNEKLVLTFMDGYYDKQVIPDYHHDPKEWWEVIDRTTGEVLATDQWSVDQENHTVIIEEPVAYHEYTVSYLIYQTWDPTQMYNHITNDWGDEVPHDIPFDVRQPNSNKYMSEYLEQWCIDNPEIDVVRFTTFFYHFTLIFNDQAKEKFVDWFGYGTSVSPKAIRAFEEEKGYRLRPEDFVDQGYYNSDFRVPSKSYVDYIDFMSQYVAKETKKLVDIVHKYGKEAMMFLGDNWMGIEPYGKYFSEIGMDAVVGSVGSGVTLRMIADIPHVEYTEGRFLPYFFPDTFYEGNKPVIEANENWLIARRAMMRNPLDRIGYGGYPSLAYKFPDFVEYIEKVTDEFREIYANIKDTKPYEALNVAIINSWGPLRTWMTHMVAHDIPYKQTYTYLGALEALSGANVNVSFLSFDEVIANGIPETIDVVLNIGDAGTAFSGGDNWKKPELLAAVRSFVDQGGGIVGIGEPSAVHHEGRYFQLADVFGVDKELGFSLSTNKYFEEPVDSHFIAADVADIDKVDFGESMKNVYATAASTEIIEFSNGEIHLASHDYGAGRGVYMAGLPYSDENSRLLMRALFYAAGKEAEMNKWFSSNQHVEVHAYPEKDLYAIVNNTNDEQVTTIYNGQGQAEEMTVAPSEIKWKNI